MFRRPAFSTLLGRLRGSRRFLQVLTGPRQVGKTTLIRQVMEAVDLPGRYASADEVTLRDRVWIEQQWEGARLLCRSGGSALLVLDEIQKIPGWASTVKALWDEDTFHAVDLRVVVLGSSPLLMQTGLTESLAGRFETIHLPHWSYPEMAEAFGWDLETYIFYGGYPGAAVLIQEPERWAGYIKDSLVETTISRDVLMLTRIDKPALLRRVFLLACEYSGQVVSYQKMVGQLQDAGNTTTVAHYLDLLAAVGMVCGLQKYAGQALRRRASSPKLQVMNTALQSAVFGRRFHQVRTDPELWGRWVESAVGATLANAAASGAFSLWYWRERGREVDFVLQKGTEIVAIEVKSGRRRTALPGASTFARRFPGARLLLVGRGGVPLEEFFRTPPVEWIPG